MVDAQVSVFSPDDVTTPWITGTTDSQGNFIFMPDPSITGDWEVQVRQAGHGEIVVIPVAAQPPATESPAPSSSSEAATENPEAASAPVDLSSSVMPMSSQPRSSQLSPVQRWVMIGAIIWGFVGTAFFFAPRTSVSDPAGEA
jgi:nickel transport protein